MHLLQLQHKKKTIVRELSSTVHYKQSADYMEEETRTKPSVKKALSATVNYGHRGIAYLQNWETL